MMLKTEHCYNENLITVIKDLIYERIMRDPISKFYFYRLKIKIQYHGQNNHSPLIKVTWHLFLQTWLRTQTSFEPIFTTCVLLCIRFFHWLEVKGRFENSQHMYRRMFAPVQSHEFIALV